MTPETVVTFGMLGTFVSVAFGSWTVFRYIGKIENKIDHNTTDINNAAKSLREKDLRLLREQKRQMGKIRGIENFLRQKLEYHNLEESKVDDTNF
ncbi:hypothetical protein [Dapis sp. BLCC M172]|uniref:hypothetical protein n=1 Tax=Dapis sp. BLCC M172 TaxID=2975281 RepID=UPI003CEDEE2B